MRAEKPSPTRELEICLDLIGRTIGTGDLAALGPLAARLDELGQRLARDPQALSQPQLRALKQKAERQMRLLDAARNGVQAAIRRVELMRRASGELATYDREGQGRTVSFQPASLEQRA